MSDLDYESKYEFLDHIRPINDSDEAKERVAVSISKYDEPIDPEILDYHTITTATPLDFTDIPKHQLAQICKKAWYEVKSEVLGYGAFGYVRIAVTSDVNNPTYNSRRGYVVKVSNIDAGSDLVGAYNRSESFETDCKMMQYINANALHHHSHLPQIIPKLILSTKCKYKTQNHGEQLFGFIIMERFDTDLTRILFNQAPGIQYRFHPHPERKIDPRAIHYLKPEVTSELLESIILKIETKVKLLNETFRVQHRDIHCSNILVRGTLHDLQVFISDFGIARLIPRGLQKETMNFYLQSEMEEMYHLLKLVKLKEKETKEKERLSRLFDNTFYHYDAPLEPVEPVEQKQENNSRNSRQNYRL